MSENSRPVYKSSKIYFDLFASVYCILPAHRLCTLSSSSSPVFSSLFLLRSFRRSFGLLACNFTCIAHIALLRTAVPG
jgi:hypothetical protein